MTTPNVAAVDRMANYYGNTLHVMPEQGGTHYVYYNPDKTFEIAFADQHYSGTYTLDGNRVCLTAIRPNDAKETTKCHGFDASRKAGDSWTESTPGGVVHFRLDAGRTFDK